MIARLAPVSWIWPALAAVLVAAGIWPAITSGFWTDEAGTWWIVNAGLTDAIARAEWWSATSPLYYSVLWIWSQLFGLTEVSLRLPSVLFTLISAVLVFRVARCWMDEEGSWLAAVMFLMSSAVSFSMIDARPYAMGLMLMLAAWLYLLRWLVSGRWRNGVFFVLFGVGAVWAHYVFALGLIPLACYVPRLGWRKTALAFAGGTILLLPRFAQLAEVSGRRSELSFVNRPDFPDLLIALVPLDLVLLLVALGIVYAATTPRRAPAFRSFVPYRTPRSLTPLLLLAILPPVLLFLLGRGGIAQLFVPRYMMAREAGLAFAAGWLMRGLTRHGARVAATAGAAAAAIAIHFLLMPGHSVDWRGASQWANRNLTDHPGSPVAVTSGFVESNVPGALQEPAKRDILFAPLTLYPVSGKLVLLPMSPTPEARKILQGQVVPAANQRGVLLVLAGPLSLSYRKILETSLRNTGLVFKEERSFRGVRGWRFVRQP